MSSGAAVEVQTQEAPHNTEEHVTELSPEELEAEKKLCVEMAKIIEHALDRIHPFLKIISEECDKASKTPKDEVDEEALVNKLRPLIEEATKILHETHGAIKGMDPEGKAANKAQRNYDDHNATEEEQRLAKGLCELTGDVTNTIQEAKEKIKDLPKAGPQLGAMMDLLTDPLFQILAAVGLLLNGVLTLVGNLLGALGLGGILKNLLAGLGLDKILKSLGLGKLLGGGKGGKDEKNEK